MKKFGIILLSIILVFGLIAPCAAAWRTFKEEETRKPYSVVVQVSTIKPTRYPNISAIEVTPTTGPVEEESVVIETVEPAQTEPTPTEKVYTTNREEEAIILAKVMYREARGISSITEQACVAWTILNRVDKNNSSIRTEATAPNQFAWDPYAPTIDDYGRDLVDLAKDIIGRWEAEKDGETDVGRVLSSNYYYFNGYNGHNWFRATYKRDGNNWDYSLDSPYES